MFCWQRPAGARATSIVFGVCSPSKTQIRPTRVDALAADMCTVMRTTLARRAGDGGDVSPALGNLTAQDLQQWVAGLEAAALALPPAVRVSGNSSSPTWSQLSQRPRQPSG